MILYTPRCLYIALQCFMIFQATRADEKPLKEEKVPTYKLGQAIPVSCLNRTVDTGEHVSDDLSLSHAEF